MLKKSLLLVVVCSLLFCCVLSSCGSSEPSGTSGSVKVYDLEACSFAVPSSWSRSDLSSEDTLMFSSEEDRAGVNVYYDEADGRSPLADDLEDVDYELGSVSVAGQDVDLFSYDNGTGAYMREFEVVLDGSLYRFAFFSEDPDAPSFEPFVQSIKFNG